MYYYNFSVNGLHICGFREIVVGEHNLLQDPDCVTFRGRKDCAPKVQRLTPEKVIIHEDYDSPRFELGNDIALIRLSTPVTLYEEDQDKSQIFPVCLPWSSNEFGRNLQTGEDVLVVGWGHVTNNRDDQIANVNEASAGSDTLLRVNSIL